MRRLLPRLFFAVVVVAQVYFVARGTGDPHKHFAWRPFNESDTWSADIVRVTRDGRRVPIEEPWAGYVWGELVRQRGLGVPRGWRHASSGAASTRAFLQEALDWVATHTPNDDETRYLEAEFQFTRNRRGPFTDVLRSVEREVP
ncbi:MAG: hypothetical protein H6721_27560 [Sandaracinus sp.]|nr:hypothetical protein [Sandaracinus sp.]MCB9635893.1 hypothetical protein [Sandaracinus sp.]